VRLRPLERGDEVLRRVRSGISGFPEIFQGVKSTTKVRLNLTYFFVLVFAREQLPL
jgi:hypothetical protein